MSLRDKTAPKKLPLADQPSTVETIVIVQPVKIK